MKLAIQIQPAVTQRAGIGRYTRELVEHLVPLLDPESSMRLDYFDFRGNATPPALARQNLNPIRWIPGRLIEKIWQYSRFPPYECLGGNADLFHFPNFIAPPVRHGKVVVSIHDLSFVRYPHFAESRNVRYLSRHIQTSTARADAIITISHFSAQEIQAFLQVPAERIFPIHLGVSPSFRRQTDTTVSSYRKAAGLERPYLLTVGTIEPRKNIPFLIDLFEHMPDYDGELVIAGGPGWRCEPIMERIARSPRSKAIRCIGFVADQDLPALYTGADAFLLASFYEGFGFPPVEAMACGTPVVSSTGGSLSEVLGEGAILFDHYEKEAWAQAIRKIRQDDQHRQGLVERGQRIASSYTWQKTAAATLALYKKLCL